MIISPNQKLVLEALEFLPIARAKHITEFIAPGRDRLRAVEYNLPALIKKGKILRERYGIEGFVYKLKGKGGIQETKIEHDLFSTEALLKFKAAKDGVIFSERFFTGVRLFPKPEWAMLYDGVIFLFEYSTANNFKRTDLMKEKVEMYTSAVKRNKEYFRAEPITVMVIEAPRERVLDFARKYNNEHFYYTDKNSFQYIKNGDQLDVPIYIWGGNGKRYPLYK